MSTQYVMSHIIFFVDAVDKYRINIKSLLSKGSQYDFFKYKIYNTNRLQV